MLSIKGLKVKLEEEDKQILKGVDLEVEAGKVHAIMGPNGSGKSTLSYVLSGKDGYEVTEGSAHLGDIDLLDLEPEERAAAGLFLAFQYPVEIPGVGNMTFHLPSEFAVVLALDPQLAFTSTSSPASAKPHTAFEVFCCKIILSVKSVVILTSAMLVEPAIAKAAKINFLIVIP